MPTDYRIRGRSPVYRIADAAGGTSEGEWRLSSDGEHTDFLALDKTGAWLILSYYIDVMDKNEDSLTEGVDYTLFEYDFGYVINVITTDLPVLLESFGYFVAHYMGEAVQGSTEGWEPYHAGKFVFENY